MLKIITRALKLLSLLLDGFLFYLILIFIDSLPYELKEISIGMIVMIIFFLSVPIITIFSTVRGKFKKRAVFLNVVLFILSAFLIYQTIFGDFYFNSLTALGNFVLLSFLVLTPILNFFTILKKEKDSLRNWNLNIKAILAFVIFIAIIIGLVSVHNYWLSSRLDDSIEKIKNINSIKYEEYGILSSKDNVPLIEKRVVWRKGKGDNMKIRIDHYLNEKSIGTNLLDFSQGVHFMCGASAENNKIRAVKLEEIYDIYIMGSERLLLDEINLVKENKLIFIGQETLDDGESFIVICYRGGINGIITKDWISEEHGICIKREELLFEGDNKWMKRDYDYKWIRRKIEVNIDISDEVFELPAGAEIISRD